MEDRSYNDGKRDAEVAALFAAVDRIEESQEKFREEMRADFKEAIDPVRKAVLGNGNARQSLVSIVAFHDRMIKWGLGLLASLLVAAIAGFVWG